MALQIRRGTDAERQLIIPAQGELIYTVDSKKLYVGDGVTTGGIGTATTPSLSNITDVVVTDPTPNHVLKFDGTHWINDSFIPNIQAAVADMLDVGVHTNIDIVYDPEAGSLSFSSTDTGILSVEQDTAPELGGNLSLNGHDITGTGNLTVTGAATLSDGLTLTPMASAPLLPVPGQIVVANGTDWDPATNGKETLVVYLGADWVVVASAV